MKRTRTINRRRASGADTEKLLVSAIDLLRGALAAHVASPLVSLCDYRKLRRQLDECRSSLERLRMPRETVADQLDKAARHPSVPKTSRDATIIPFPRPKS